MTGGAETVLTRMARPPTSSAGLHIWSDGSWQRHAYSDLVERAERVGAGLEARGIEPGDRVAAIASTSAAFVVSSLAIWRAGAAIVPVQPATRVGQRVGSADAARAHVQMARAQAVLIGEGDDVGKQTVPVWNVGELERAGEAGAKPTDDDVAIVQFTSGSTSTAKGVMLTHSAILTQVDACAQRYELRPGDRFLSWLPLYHLFGFMRQTLFPMVWGVDSCHFPMARFMSDPLSWLEEITLQQATATAGASSAYATVAKRLQAAPQDVKSRFDLRSLRVACCGAEPLSARAARSFCNSASEVGLAEDAFRPGYGLAEASGVTFPDGLRVDCVARTGLPKGVAQPVDDGPDVTEFVCNGPPLPGVEVKIVEEGGEMLSERHLGEILVRGPNVMKGYFENEEETNRVLRDGWLRTGDLGYRLDGEVYVVGRIKNVIILGGRNYVAEDLERIAMDVSGVQTCVAFGARGVESEELVLMVETDLVDPSEKTRSRDAITRRLWRDAGIRVRDVALVGPGAIPKTPSGKLQRLQARYLYEQGAPAPWKTP